LNTGSLSDLGPGWQAGATVGRYLLLTPIAEGGMAQIWLARQTGVKGFEKLVVVKRMVSTLETDPEHVEMFLTEARLAAQLDHPHVVQIFELGEQQGAYYIAMEYLDGENLSYIRRASIQRQLFMSDALSAQLVAWAAEGLHYAHTRVGPDGKSAGVVHRDVSPQNLVVTYQGGLKVVDFGIAKMTDQHTNSGKLKGKIAYMSPEQARTEATDGRSDVFALGVVLFEQLSRTRLIGRQSELETLRVMSGGEPFPLVTTRRPDVPEPLVEIVAKALERNPKDRFQSARELQQALEGWIRSTGQSASSADLTDYMQQLFGPRIAERRKLIEAARRLEFSPQAASELKDIATGIMPGSGSSKVSRSKVYVDKPVRRAPAILAGLAITMVLAGWATWATLRSLEAPPPSPPVVVAPANPTPAPPEPSVLAIDTQPAGASVQVDGEARGASPVTVSGLALGEHQIEAQLDGYQALTRAVKIERMGQRLDLTLALVAVAATPEPASVPPGKTTPTVRRQSGKLTLKTEPWTTVYLGSKRLGDTPLLEVSVPAGRLVLKLVNPESGVQSSIEVEIPANGTLVKKLKL
jgi:eukaryotic-like serine/threonine-protein kinase